MPPNRDFVSRKIPANPARDVPAFEITHGDFLKRVSKAFRDHTGNRPGAAQELANEIECSDKTTKSWLDGKTAPSGLLDLRAMNRIPAYAALKDEIAAMQRSLDPRVQAKVMELVRMSQQLADGHRLDTYAPFERGED